MKKYIQFILLGLLITVSSVYAGSKISYVLNKTVREDAIVGESVKYTDGLVVTLREKSPYTLTYNDIEETEEYKHSITYIYDYEILVDGLDIEVSNLSSDIEVLGIESDDSTIWITFGLNQDKDFDTGDSVRVEFYFEGVSGEVESININTATVEDLGALGFNEIETNNIVMARQGSLPFTDLDNLALRTGIENIHERFDELVNNETIVFN